ncbi:MAG: hypothetical protein VX834_02580, partial [Myxococcota bacterium]|nr:hypothetical protein [Myxococcota bacterium]
MSGDFDDNLVELDPEDAQGGGTLKLIITAIIACALGLIVGFGVTNESPEDQSKREAELHQALAQARARIAELERSLTYQNNQAQQVTSALSAESKAQLQERGRQYAAVMRKNKHKRAADLIEWFVGRWTELLDRPQDGDRTGRRAELLSKFVGAMGENLNPGDFTVWQSELLGKPWLPEIGFDLDQDGYPAKRGGQNPRDSFTETSVCQVAMALNQTILNAQVLVMPEMR